MDEPTWLSPEELSLKKKTSALSRAKMDGREKGRNFTTDLVALVQQLYYSNLQIQRTSICMNDHY